MIEAGHTFYWRPHGHSCRCEFMPGFVTPTEPLLGRCVKVVVAHQHDWPARERRERRNAFHSTRTHVNTRAHQVSEHRTAREVLGLQTGSGLHNDLAGSKAN